MAQTEGYLRFERWSEYLRVEIKKADVPTATEVIG